MSNGLLDHTRILASSMSSSMPSFDENTLAVSCGTKAASMAAEGANRADVAILRAPNNSKCRAVVDILNVLKDGMEAELQLEEKIAELNLKTQQLATLQKNFEDSEKAHEEAVAKEKEESLYRLTQENADFFKNCETDQLVILAK